MNDSALRRHRARRLRFFLPALVISLLCGMTTSTAGARTVQVHLSTAPALFPAFSQSVTDYVVRCQSTNSIRLFVSALGNTSISIDGAAARSGMFTRSVGLSDGQSFEFSVSAAGQTTTHYVRCLPSDFPHFSATRSGTPQAEWYVATPSGWFTPLGTSRQYVAIFDDNGVPVWWERAEGNSPPRDAKLLANGDIIWTHAWGIGGSGAEEHSLDGSLVRTVHTVDSGMDHHDIVRLPNGNFLAGRTFSRDGVDMSGCGGSSSGTMLDFELQELTPTGVLLWSWRASDHIAVSEVTPNWRKWCRISGDIYHWNSVDPVGGDFVLSFRHLDAVYRIDGATGAVKWKLGGTPRPESLSVAGDPLANPSPLDGQHDARMLQDGSLTVFDDGSGSGRPPRAVRFAIDETARTATLLESMTDPIVPRAFCCGSARELPGGDWVTSWGNSAIVTEQTNSGAPVFQLEFAHGVFSYRVNPVLPGILSRTALRAGMDSQHPRS